MVNIAVLGYGTVGSGVVEVINTNGSIINRKAGEEINIKYVLDLRDFPGDPVEKILVHDFETILNDEDVKVVVEVMGGVEPAYTVLPHLTRSLWLPTVLSFLRSQQTRALISSSRLQQAAEYL